MEFPKTDFVYAAENVEGEFRDDYSGRGMYGASCPGLVVDDYRQALQFAIQLVRQGTEFEEDEEKRDNYLDLVEELVAKLNTDSMGLGIIIYFPGVELV